MTGRRAQVRLDGRRCGLLEETNGNTRFTYDDAYLALPDAVPVSLTIPLDSTPHEHGGLHPFFENLLPEGWLLDISTAKLKIQKDDLFGLLLATCRDCIGAVEIVPETGEEVP